MKRPGLGSVRVVQNPFERYSQRIPVLYSARSFAGRKGLGAPWSKVSGWVAVVGARTR